MAMSVVYATVNGQLSEESRGGSVTTYVSDTLGSVIQTRNAAGAQTSSTEFWPYGDKRVTTGTNPTPWGFCGTLGYYTDVLDQMYVRARHYRADMALWLTIDPLWPDESAYSYAHQSPIFVVDASGAWPQLPTPPGMTQKEWCLMLHAQCERNAGNALTACSGVCLGGAGLIGGSCASYCKFVPKCMAWCLATLAAAALCLKGCLKAYENASSKCLNDFTECMQPKHKPKPVGWNSCFRNCYRNCNKTYKPCFDLCNEKCYGIKKPVPIPWLPKCPITGKNR